MGMNAGFVTTLEFPNSEKIKEVEMPLLWMHGTDDTYISIDNGELIYANYSGIEGRALRIEGGEHGDIPNVMGVTSYMNEVLDFIRN